MISIILSTEITVHLCPMKSIFLALIIFTGFQLQALAQCNCSGSGFGMGIFDQGAGFLQNEQSLSAQLTYESRYFAPHAESGHEHHHSTDTTESTGSEINNMNLANLSLVFQPHERWLILLQMPYLNAQTNLGAHSGNGDLSLVTGYGLLNHENHKLFLLAGMELPTGKVLPLSENPAAQFGSGGLDATMGLTYGLNFGQWSLQSNAVYKRTGKNKNFDNTGNISQFNLTALYDILPSTSSCRDDSVSAVRESISWKMGLTGNFEQYGIQTQNNSRIALSGGTVVWSGITSVFNFKKFSFPLLVSIPVMQDWKGDSQKSTFRWRAGISYSF